MTAKSKLGEILVESSMINNEQLQKSLVFASDNNIKLGDALVKLNILTEDEIYNALSKQLELDLVNLYEYKINDQLALLLNEKIAREKKAILLEYSNNTYTVGFVDPLDLDAYDTVSRELKAPVKIALVKNIELQEVLDRLYSNREEIAGFADEVSSLIASSSDIFKELATNINVSSAPIVKLLNSLISDAIKSRASDIHIEPSHDKLRIRLRVDGELRETILPDVKIGSVLAQILKLKAKLNITETRLPQDGRFDIDLYNRKIDVRLATMPTTHGESVVLRLLDQSKPLNNLNQLGMKSEMIEKIYKLLSNEHGMILVTGPTGSGKTTTLYSVLQRLNKANKKIITVEDPVEYTIDRVNQVQVNYKIDLDFQRVLKSVLRHDPDIIMVGEIRDRETARIAMRAAITGHLVLATLHTNDALTSAIRLVDIGQEGYIVASALKAILSQRLVKLNCDKCTIGHELQPQAKEWLSRFSYIKESEFSLLKQGKGCQRCHNTGYFGRVAIYELLELNEDMLDALRCDSITDFVAAARSSDEFTTLLAEAFTIAKQGRVSVFELMRIFGEIEEERVALNINYE